MNFHSERKLPTYFSDEDKETIALKVCERIDDYLANKYPDFKQSLFDTVEKIENKSTEKLDEIEKTEKECKRLLQNYIDNIKSEKLRIVDDVKKEINNFLSQEHPGVFSKINALKVDLEHLLVVTTERNDSIKKAEKKLITSVSLYEDVYKMRDEFKKLSEQVESFLSKMKKLWGR